MAIAAELPDLIRQDLKELLASSSTRAEEIYRQLAPLLFWKYDTMPTANLMYSLVKRGSMSVPTQAVRDFWIKLREKTRTSFHAPDLPEPVRESFGRAIADMWDQARGMASEELAALRSQAEEDVRLAQAAQQKAEDDVKERDAVLLEAKQLALQYRNDHAAALVRAAAQEARADELERRAQQAEAAIEQMKVAAARERQELMDSHAALVRRLHLDLDNERQEKLAQKHLATIAMDEALAKQQALEADLVDARAALAAETVSFRSQLEGIQQAFAEQQRVQADLRSKRLRGSGRAGVRVEQRVGKAMR